MARVMARGCDLIGNNCTCTIVFGKNSRGQFSLAYNYILYLSFKLHSVDSQ